MINLILFLSLSTFAQNTDEVPKEIKLNKNDKVEKKLAPTGGAIKFSCKDGDKEYRPTDSGYKECVSKTQKEFKEKEQKQNH